MIAKIISRKTLSEQLIKLEIRPSERFAATQPGEYVVLGPLSENTAIILPIIKNETSRETLTLVAPCNEKVEGLLNSDLSNGQLELEGPFGQPFKIEKFGTVLCVADYNCMVPLLPVITSLRLAGNKITCLLTQNAGTNLILESEIRKNSDHWLATDENQHRSIQLLEQALRAQKYDQAFVIGQTKTIRETSSVSTATRTRVQSMLFLDNWNRSGKHGIFRVSVSEKNHSICVDGHNFNAYYTSFDSMARRFAGKESELLIAEQIEIPR